MLSLTEKKDFSATADRLSWSMNAMEPKSLQDAFHNYPPAGFTALKLSTTNGEAPAFLADFDILTTLEDEHRWIIDCLNRLKASCLTTFSTVFSGTTVTEYTSYPELNAPDCQKYIEGLIDLTVDSKAQLLIIKDLPLQSPLLSKKENSQANTIAELCAGDGRFIMVEGQALAYAPMNFSSIDEYLSRCGKKTRKDLRRKLRSKSELEIEAAPTGERFQDSALVDLLFKQYMNVYEQSKYHFDKLSRQFFEAILTDKSNNGLVFLYKKEGQLIGYNICFVHENMLVDKYVGFEYPQARQSNLYFVSWFNNLEYALANNLTHYIAGWTDPEVKAYLGASFTMTRHAVYIRNPVLRKVIGKFRRCFENDKNFSNTDAVPGGAK